MINKQFLYVYSYIDNKKGLIVFEIKSNSLKQNSTSDLLEYYVVSKSGDYILSSNDFKNDINTKYTATNKFLIKEDYLYYYKPFDDYILGTKVSKKVLFQRINTAFMTISIAIILMILLSMMQSINASSRITTPIHQKLFFKRGTPFALITKKSR